MARGKSLLAWVKLVGHKLWSLLASMRLAVILIAVVALGALLGTLFPQLPSDLAADPTLRAHWLALAQRKYGPLAGLYEGLGLFDVFHSPWFLFALAALLLSTTVCTLNRIRATWRRIVGPPPQPFPVDGGGSRRGWMPDSFFERAADRAWLALPSATQATTRLQSVLKRHRYRVLAESQDGVTHLYADKNRWALVGTLITHLSVVTLVIAAAWGGAFAWREDGITLAPGEVHQIRDPSTTLGTGFGLRFDRLEIDRYPSGMPSDYRGYLTVLDGGSEVLSRVVRVNNPLTYRDVAFYLWSYGPAVRVHATDASGQPLLLPAMPPKGVDRTEIVLTFGGEGDVRGFSVPTQDLIVRLTFEAAPSSAMPRGAFFVEAFRSGDARPFFADVIRPGESLQQAGVRFDFGFENYVVLAAVSDPSFNAVIAIVLVMWVGLALSFYFPYHRLWARITAAGEVHLAGLPERNRIGLEEEFASLVADFQHVLERSG